MAASNKGETPENFESDNSGRAVAAARPGTTAGMATGPGVIHRRKGRPASHNRHGLPAPAVTAAYLDGIVPSRSDAPASFIFLGHLASRGRSKAELKPLGSPNFTQRLLDRHLNIGLATRLPDLS